MLITNDWLKRKWACPDQRTTFHKLFPDGCEVTIENAEKADKAGLDVTWAHVRCLDRKGQKAFILFCLRQGQPYLVNLFKKAKLAEHAKAIAALDWSDLKVARDVLLKAKATAYAASYAYNAYNATAYAYNATAAATAASYAYNATAYNAYNATAAATAASYAYNATAYAYATARLKIRREQWQWVVDYLKEQA